MKIIPLRLLLYSFLCKVKERSLKVKKLKNKKNNATETYILLFKMFSHLEVEIKKKKKEYSCLSS